jgi:type II secretory pathway pseudopilin PulG
MMRHIVKANPANATRRDAARERHPPRARQATRGFTVLEVVVALALTSLVVASAFGLLAMMRSADRAVRTMTAGAGDQLQAYAVMQRAFTSMVAAQPLRPEADDDAAADDPTDALDGANLPPGVREQVAGLLGSGAPAAGLDERLDAAVASVDTSVPPHFELYYEEIDGVSLPRLEVVVQQSPLSFGGMRSVADRFERDLEDMNAQERRSRLARAWAGSIRGVFELVAIGERGWCLVWQPVRPLGERTVLVERLAALEWSVLLPPPEQALDDPAAPPAPGEWVPVHAAYLAGDYPDAISLKYVTERGVRANWRFETRTIDPGR